MSPGPDVIRVGLVDDQLLVRAGFAMVINSQPDLRVEVEAGTGEEAVRLLAEHPVDVVLMDVRMPGMDGLSATEAVVRRPDSPRVIVLTTFDLDEYVLGAIRAGASGFLVKDTPPEDMLAAIRTVHAGDAVIGPSSTRRLLAHLATVLPGSGGRGGSASAGEAADRVSAGGSATGLGPSGGAPSGGVATGGPPSGGPPSGGAGSSGGASSGGVGSSGVSPAAAAVATTEALTEREREVLVLMARGRSNAEIGSELVVAEATVKTHVGRILTKLGARDRVQAVVVAYEAGLVTPGF